MINKKNIDYIRDNNYSVKIFTLLFAGQFYLVYLCRLPIFLKLKSSRKSFRNIITVSNRLGSDQTQRLVGSDLGPNCLQKESASVKIRNQRVKGY